MTGCHKSRSHDDHRRRLPRGGWTLIEMVVAAALFVVVGLIGAYLFRNALQHSEEEVARTEAQANARRALKLMRDELGHSLRIPHANPVGSPVVRPSMAASGSYNDLMFFVPATDLANLDLSNLASYRLVRYYVPAASPNRLRRAVYSVNSNTFSGTPLTYAANEGPPTGAVGSPPLFSPMATPTLATAQGAHWFVNTGAIPAATLGATTPPYEEDVVIMQGNNDIMAFTVTHEAIATPARDSFQANFDRLTFRIEVQAIRYLSIDNQVPARTRGAVRVLGETVKVPDQAM